MGFVALSHVTSGAASDTTGALDALVARLCHEYGVDAGDVGRAVQEVHSRYVEARIQSYVPILVEKELRDMFRHRRPTLTPVPE